MALYNYEKYTINNYIEIDYMRENMLLSSYLLLFIFIWYLLKIDGENMNLNFNLSCNNKSQNNNERYIFNTRFFESSKDMNISSAENIKGFSETIRQSDNLGDSIISSMEDVSSSKILSSSGVVDSKSEGLKDNKFWAWFAGIMDGDGYIQVRTINGEKKLKTIEVKLHNRDIRILTRILDKLHMGRIYRYKNNDYSKWIVSTQVEMKEVLENLNGLMRLKVTTFKEGCSCVGIEYKEANYNIEENDPYFSGLIDTDGSIVFNYTGNRIECNLEFKDTEYTRKLNLDRVVKGYKPGIMFRKHKLGDKVYYSKKFTYQTVSGMIFLYDYFMINRLYSDFKFYRVSQIKPFISIRKFNKSPYSSEEFLIYSEFLLNFIQYLNPKWNKTPFVSKLRMKR